MVAIVLGLVLTIPDNGFAQAQFPDTVQPGPPRASQAESTSAALPSAALPSSVATEASAAAQPETSVESRAESPAATLPSPAAAEAQPDGASAGSRAGVEDLLLQMEELNDAPKEIRREGMDIEELSRFEEQLEELVSVSSYSPESLDRAPAVVALFTRKQIEAIGARSLADVLRLVPGMDVGMQNSGVVQPFIRGLDQPADVLLLVDGQRMNNTLTGAARFELPAVLLERVEVIRGPGSALYGSNAFLAVVSVTTRSPRALEASARYGRFGTAEGSLSAKQQFGDWAVRGFFDYGVSNGPDFVVDSDFLTERQPQSSEAPAPVNGAYERFNAGLTMQRGPFELGGLFWQEQRSPYVGSGNVLVREGELSNRFFSAWTKVNLELSQRIRLLGQLNFSQWTIDDRAVSMPPGWSATGEVFDADRDGIPEVFPDGLVENEAYRALTAGGDVRLAWNHGQIGRLTLGAQANFQALRDGRFETNIEAKSYRTGLADYGNRSLPDEDRTFLAPYLLWERRFADWIGATAGLRYDRYSDFGGALSPMAVLVFEPWSNGSIKALYGRAFRAPTFLELYSRHSLYMGNPDLQAETIQTFELSVGQHFLTHFHAQASIFHMKVDHRIDVPRTTSVEGENPYLNHEGTEGFGGDVELRATWSDGTFAFANLAYHSTTDELTGLALERIPTWSANLGGSLALWQDLRLGGTLRYRSARNPPELTYFQQERLLGHDEPATWMLDLSVRKDRLVEGLWARLSAYNVLGTDYREVPADTSFTLGYGRKGVNLPTEPRTVLLELGHAF